MADRLICRDPEELGLWVQYCSIFVNVWKLGPIEAGLQADDCIREFRLRKPVLVPTTSTRQ